MQSVNELCEKGNSLSEVGMYQEALSCFKHALEKTPETYDYEDERVWILVAIGDTLFQLQQYSNAMDVSWIAFSDRAQYRSTILLSSTHTPPCTLKGPFTYLLRKN